MAEFKAAFIFVAPDTDPKEHRVKVSTPSALELGVSKELSTGSRSE